MTDPDTIGTYQAVADEYRERHGDRSGVRELVEQFLGALKRPADPGVAKVADVGCGPGWESATFAERGHEVGGVDLTPAFLDVAREEAPGVEFARMDVRSLGFERNAFDGLRACVSFLHVPRDDAPATLREFRRALRPGGALFLSVKGGDGETEGDTYDRDSRQFTHRRFPDEEPPIRRTVERTPSGLSPFSRYSRSASTSRSTASPMRSVLLA